MKILSISVTSLLLILTIACDSKKNNETFIAPGSEADSGVVYGKYSISRTSKDLRNMNVAAIMEKSNVLVDATNIDKLIVDVENVQERYGTCDKFALNTEMSAAHCSGLLIKNNTVVTAAHCIDAQFRCEDMVAVFGFTSDQKKYAQSFEKDQVYNCESVQIDHEKDVAYLKLDRKVKGFKRPRVITEMRAVDLVGQAIYSLGYPLGTGLKKTEGLIRGYDEKTKTLKTTLDSFDRSSGSPVFLAATGQFLGLLLNGEMDFYTNSSQDCQQIVHCKENECLGESVLSAKEIL